ncbi:MAG TPA: pseudouridine synthase [Allosphingosinicella sp.]|nr:pseudouridine synthase [Allosphingosinicella sp.]
MPPRRPPSNDTGGRAPPKRTGRLGRPAAGARPPRSTDAAATDRPRGKPTGSKRPDEAASTRDAKPQRSGRARPSETSGGRRTARTSTPEAVARREARPERPARARARPGEATDRREARPQRPARARPGEALAPREPRPPRPARARPSEGAAPAAPRAALPAHASGEPQRIAKLLARAGIASRREIERMIEDGRIAIAGKTVETPATILTTLQGVTVDGKPVAAAEPTRLFRFHKPAGFLTAERDPGGRPTIYDRLPKGLPRVMPVGRLDMNTEGLLLLTTDGGFKRQLELPATGVERTYRARTFGEITQETLETLIHGIEIEGIRYGPIDANLERRTGRNQWIEMKLREGKNREVRRVLEHLGLQVSRLIRTAYGPFYLGDLPVGAVDEVRQNELATFRKGMKG